MTEVIQMARLHERTVMDAQKHIKKSPRKVGKRAGVTIASIDPRVWRTAKKLAGGNARRIKRISPTEVIVLNNPVK